MQLAQTREMQSMGAPMNHNLLGSSSRFDPSTASSDDFFDQMFSSIPSWPDLANPATVASGYDESLSAQQQQQLLFSYTDSGLLTPLPLSLGAAGHGSDSDASFKSASSTSFGGVPPAAVSAPSGAGAPAAPRQRVRARRGQATDPHSIAERLRRERIAEGMKALHQLVPQAKKTDKASMLDEIMDYVKSLQLEIKGAAAAVGRGSPTEKESMLATEVAKYLKEDMGSAKQYLQGLGLSLIPISLASAISTASRRDPTSSILASSGTVDNLASLIPGIPAGADAPSSPSLSVLTVQSAVAGGFDTDLSRSSGKDGAASVSKL